MTAIPFTATIIGASAWFVGCVVRTLCVMVSR